MAVIASRREAEEKQRARLLYSMKDFQLSLSAADFLLECDPNKSYSKIELRRFKCYKTTSLVAYSRPFTPSNGYPKLSLKKIGAELSNEQKRLHEEILSLRNKEYAHSDFEMMRMLTKTHSLELPGDKFHFLEMKFDEGLSYVGAKNFELIELVRTVFAAALNKVYNQLQANPKVWELDVDYLRDNE